MATSIRRGDGVGKEKKGISAPSSTSSTTTRKPTTRPLTSSNISSHGDKKTVSSSTARQSPSKLRPTRTAPNELSRLSKKPITTEPSNPKSAPRRKSFAHPPPPSQVQKAIRDAKNSRSATTLKNTTKSSSASPLSSRPTPSSRPVKKDVPSSSLSMSPSLKKNALSSVAMTPRRGPGPTKGTSCSLVKKATKSSMLESNLLHVGISSVIDDPLASFEDDLVNLDDDDVQSLPEISEMPICGSDLGDPDTLEDDLVKQPIEDEDHNYSNLEDGHHEVEDDVSVVDMNNVAEEPATQDTITLDDVQIEGKQFEDQNNVELHTNEGEHKHMEEEISDEEVKKGESNKETMSEVKKEDVAPIKEEEKMEKDVEMKTETNTKNEKIDDAKTSRESNVANNNVVSTVKKENQQAYNDVIEQTATKLMSKKNKVLALAGAFETVISLQDKN